MMNNFAYVKAGSLAEAIKALSTKGAWLHAGGTDLLGCARNEILQVEKVVSISGLKQLKGISAQPDGGVKIGALTSLAEIAAQRCDRGKVCRTGTSRGRRGQLLKSGNRARSEETSASGRAAGISAAISSALKKAAPRAMR